MNILGCGIMMLIVGGTVVGIVGVAWVLVERLTKDKNE